MTSTNITSSKLVCLLILFPEQPTILTAFILLSTLKTSL
jgi:hypothetical protein